MVQSKESVGEQARYGTHAKLLLAFWASIGFKPEDFMTKGMTKSVLRGFAVSETE